MNENEFEYKGVTYQTVEQRDYKFLCKGCAFRSSSENCRSTPRCSPWNNGYGAHVIFVEKA